MTPWRPRAVAGCDIVFHVAAKAGVWGPLRGYYQCQCRRHGKRHCPPAVITGFDAWFTPVRRASSSMAATWKRRRIGAVSLALPGSLPGDQGYRRENGTRSERPGAGDGGAAAASHLGPGRQPSDPAPDRPRPRRQAAPHRRRQRSSSTRSLSTMPPTLTSSRPTACNPVRRSRARRTSFPMPSRSSSGISSIASWPRRKFRRSPRAFPPKLRTPSARCLNLFTNCSASKPSRG